MIDAADVADAAGAIGVADRLNPPDFPTVHAPLNWWSQHRPETLAIDDGQQRLSFAELAQRVAAGAAGLERVGSAAIAWADDGSGPLAQLVGFLAIVASGRSAAVSDPDWPPQVRDQVRQRVSCLGRASARPSAPGAESPFYIGFTSGSTGLPKGFERSHRSWTSSFSVCLDTFGPAASTPVLAPGRLSHSLFLFGALLGLWTGAGCRLQPRFSAAAALETLRCGDAGSLVAVPSQLLLMLESARRQRAGPIDRTRLILIGGAPWPRALTPQLQALFPEARIVEFYGASETSFIAWADSDPQLPDTAVGRPFANVQVRIAGADAVEAGAPDGCGLIYVRSPMLFHDYIPLGSTADDSVALREGDWLSVRDVGHIDAAGLLHLLGRQQRMLLVQGKNLFPEEVESVLAAHPAVEAASVIGVPHPVRGMRPVALLALAHEVGAEALSAWCRTRLARYKIPRRFYACAEWPRTPGGKTDHPALARRLAAEAAPAEHGVRRL